MSFVLVLFHWKGNVRSVPQVAVDEWQRLGTTTSVPICVYSLIGCHMPDGRGLKARRPSPYLPPSTPLHLRA